MPKPAKGGGRKERYTWQLAEEVCKAAEGACSSSGSNNTVCVKRERGRRQARSSRQTRGLRRTGCPPSEDSDFLFPSRQNNKITSLPGGRQQRRRGGAAFWRQDIACSQRERRSEQETPLGTMPLTLVCQQHQLLPEQPLSPCTRTGDGDSVTNNPFTSIAMNLQLQYPMAWSQDAGNSCS